ncbi:hypothetical protein CHARACLAT_014348 [Characodon lateralis]|uniref:Uncharacterized protein n=1 Tax=Characodon lateralis TaxID=208331 RepID=A0ABU7DR20_9TELE|nr:hypothetical protein [Characodon lateralis]
MFAESDTSEPEREAAGRDKHLFLALLQQQLCALIITPSVSSGTHLIFNSGSPVLFLPVLDKSDQFSGLHGLAVVRTVALQQKDPGFESRPFRALWSLHQ